MNKKQGYKRDVQVRLRSSIYEKLYWFKWLPITYLPDFETHQMKSKVGGRKRKRRTSQRRRITYLQHQKQ